MSLSQDEAKSVLAELERRLKEGGLAAAQEIFEELVELERERQDMPKLVPPTEEPRLPYREPED